MPRLLNLRALCSSCERAEASHWCGTSSSALCASCLRRRPVSASWPVPVPIQSNSVVAALCGRCGVAPAAVFAVDAATPLCEICAPREHKHHSPNSREKQKRHLVPLKESAAAHGLVFDKMDFSSLYHGQGDRKPKTGLASEQRAGKVDLSYYKTEVPMSVVSSKSRRKRGKRDGDDTSRSGKERRKKG